MSDNTSKLMTQDEMYAKQKELEEIAEGIDKRQEELAATEKEVDAKLKVIKEAGKEAPVQAEKEQTKNITTVAMSIVHTEKVREEANAKALKAEAKQKKS